MQLMKTTIDLPEELLHRAKITAAQRKTTLKDLVVRGLEYATSHELPEPGERKAHVQRLLAALQAVNVEPMQPLTRAAIYDR